MGWEVGETFKEGRQEEARRQKPRERKEKDSKEDLPARQGPGIQRHLRELAHQATWDTSRVSRGQHDQNTAWN